MYRKELNERSPLRLLEKSIHGGLGRGNIGVVAARHGVGKTAVLVSIALDDLMRGRRVLHVSLDDGIDKIRGFYGEIFLELAKSAGHENVDAELMEMERFRNIHSFVGASFSVPRLRETVARIGDQMNFFPATLILDGFDFERATGEEMADLRAIAGEIDGELWMSAVIHRDSPRNERGIPEPLTRFENNIDVILALEPEDRQIELRLLKDHDNFDVGPVQVTLDPTTLLLK
ncbi:MAG: hypothetical protein QM330_12300 [Acidobacteriota bacterium]|jgi:hypothetical protein|nr:hypothetical protein [Acidobacteriota bacterium]NLT32260.1 hypothetical protein [Acidobacteriota bacterium]